MVDAARFPPTGSRSLPGPNPHTLVRVGPAAETIQAVNDAVLFTGMIESVTAVENADEIEARDGRAMAVQVDVGDPASIQTMVDAVVAEHGRIDVLINNAGIFASLAKRKFELIPQEEWDLVMRVNINGVMVCARAVAPIMRKNGWGRIINIASDAVPKGVMNYLHHVTSKSALIGMTNAMARELDEDGINVNCIRPGAVATEVDRAVNPTVDLRKTQIALYSQLVTGAKGKTMKIGVVGLGSMGYGIAASLLRAGHAVCGADMNAAAVARLQAAGGMSEDIAQAAPGLDALAVVVLNSLQVEAVLFGPRVWPLPCRVARWSSVV